MEHGSKHHKVPYSVNNKVFSLNETFYIFRKIIFKIPAISGNGYALYGTRYPDYHGDFLKDYLVTEHQVKRLALHFLRTQMGNKEEPLDFNELFFDNYDLIDMLRYWIRVDGNLTLWGEDPVRKTPLEVRIEKLEEDLKEVQAIYDAERLEKPRKVLKVRIDSLSDEIANLRKLKPNPPDDRMPKRERELFDKNERAIDIVYQYYSKQHIIGVGKNMTFQRVADKSEKMTLGELNRFLSDFNFEKPVKVRPFQKQL
jgi:hypothetical protein